MSTGLDTREFEDTLFASSSVARHYVRGAAGLAFVLVAMALTPLWGPGSLLLALPALVLWRGCPTCWTVGLMQTKQVCAMRPRD